MTSNKHKQLFWVSFITFILILLLAIFIAFKIKEEEKNEYFVQLGRANAISRVLATSLDEHLKQIYNELAQSVSKKSFSNSLSQIDGLMILNKGKLTFPQVISESFFNELSNQVSHQNRKTYKEIQDLINEQKLDQASNELKKKKTINHKDNLLFKHLKSILLLKQNNMKKRKVILEELLLDNKKEIANLPWIFWESIFIGYLDSSSDNTRSHNQILLEMKSLIPNSYLNNDLEYFWQKLEKFSHSNSSLNSSEFKKLMTMKKELHRISMNSLACKKLNLQQFPVLQKEQSSFRIYLKDKPYLVQNNSFQDKTIFVLLSWSRIKKLLNSKINQLQKSSEFEFKLIINNDKKAMVSRSFLHFPAIALTAQATENWLNQIKNRNQLYFILLAITVLIILGCLYFLYKTMIAQLNLAKMRSDFVTNVSHELRTPVAAIQLMSETLSNQSIKEEKDLLEYYQLIHDDSKRLSNLINNVLDFSKLENSIRNYDFTTHNLLKTVNKIKQSLELGSTNIVINAENDEINFKYDSDAMEQIFTNIITNSIKYAQKGQNLEIIIGINLTKTNVEINIADNGKGINQNDLPFVFEKFFRGGDLTTQNVKGNGLGLCIVKQLIEDHGGEVKIESIINQGTTIFIRFPIKP